MAAKLFVEEGAYVFITGRRQSELDKAKASIGRNVATVQGDVSNLEDLDRLEHFDKTFNINARGAFFTVQKAAPLMRDGGAIVLLSSGVHLKGIPSTRPTAPRRPHCASGPGAWPPNSRTDAGREMFRQMTPLGRIGRPEEMAKAILFLGSDDSSYTTGADLAADGGITQL